MPGYSRNPYDTKRTTAGSSGGTAAAVSCRFWDDWAGNGHRKFHSRASIAPESGWFRPTLGLVSRDGIAPLAMTNDTGGPICRTVEDAVRVLDVIAGYDKADTVTQRSNGKIPATYRQFLDKNGLKGARIGVFRQLVMPKNSDPQVYALFNKALDELRAAGATVIDSVRVPELDTINKSFDTIPQLRRDFNLYLANLGPECPPQNAGVHYQIEAVSPLSRKVTAGCPCRYAGSRSAQRVGQKSGPAGTVASTAAPGHGFNPGGCAGVSVVQLPAPADW